MKLRSQFAALQDIVLNGSGIKPTRSIEDVMANLEKSIEKAERLVATVLEVHREEHGGWGNPTLCEYLECKLAVDL